MEMLKRLLEGTASMLKCGSAREQTPVCQLTPRADLRLFRRGLLLHVAIECAKGVASARDKALEARDNKSSPRKARQGAAAVVLTLLCAELVLLAEGILSYHLPFDECRGAAFIFQHSLATPQQAGTRIVSGDEGQRRK